MTAQQPDILIVDGEKVSLYSTPLDPYIARRGKGWPFASAITSYWRGYVATWEIEDDVLFLVALKGWIATKPLRASHPMDISLRENLEALPSGGGWAGLVERALNPRQVPLTFLFPEAGDRVAATWFSGELRVPRGERLQYEHMGFGSVYEEDLILSIDRGRVTKREVMDRRAELCRNVATNFVAMATANTPVLAGIDREALRTAIVRFAEAANPEELGSASNAPEERILLGLADQLGFDHFQTALREALSAESSSGPM